MNMDGFILKALVQELANALKGQRIEKIHQPNSHNLMFQLAKQRLSINTDPQNPYIVIGGPRLENPQAPPFFCLMLRKHLTNARITEVAMPDFERIVAIECLSRDELGEPCAVSLMIELTGRHGNVLLVNQSGIILDALRRVPLGNTATRPVFPGLRYELPPEQAKILPRELMEVDLAALAQSQDMSVAQFVSTNIQGVSLVLSKEIAHRLDMKGVCREIEPSRWREVQMFVTALAESCSMGEIGSAYLSNSPGKQQLHIIPLTHLGESTEVAGINNTIADQLNEAHARHAKEQLRNKLERSVNGHLKKLWRLSEALTRDLASTHGKDKDKRYGELLYANLGQCKIVADVAMVTDYYDNAMPEVAIPIDPHRSISDNAKAYFRKYEKAVGRETYAKNRFQETLQQEAYLQGLIMNIGQADDLATLQEIEVEMTEQELLPRPAEAKKGSRSGQEAKKKVAGSPREFISPDGFRILVGRNNLQNDWILKSAKPSDLWFHVQKAPGSHCLVQVDGPVPVSTIEYAAGLAARFSSMCESSSVPVDYTERRNVKRPRGAKPGFVIYERQQTVLVKMSDTHVAE